MWAKSWLIAVAGVAVIVAGIITIATHSSSSSASTPRPATHGATTTRPGVTSSATTSPTQPVTPTPAVPTTPASSPSAGTSPTGKHDGKQAGQEPQRAKDEAKNGPITYVVKPGDNLWDIAEWFHLHGYGALYQWNRTVIGDNPALIHPGQRIVVSASGNQVSR